LNVIPAFINALSTAQRWPGIHGSHFFPDLFFLSFDRQKWSPRILLSLFGCSGDSSFRIIVVGSPSRLKVFSISFISHFVNKGISHVASDLNIPIEIAIALKDIYG